MMTSRLSFLSAGACLFAACRSSDPPPIGARGDAAPGVAAGLAGDAADGAATPEIHCGLPGENCEQAMAETPAAGAGLHGRGSPPAPDLAAVLSAGPPASTLAPDPRSPPYAPPLPPTLAAHLSRIPVGTGPHIVVQVDAAAVVGADILRGAAQGLERLVAGEIQGDAACMVELLAAIEAVTYVMVDGEDAPDTGIALVDGDLDLPGIVECALQMTPAEVPASAMREANEGHVRITEHVAAAGIGPRTLAVGSVDLVETARSSPVHGSLAESESFARARALAGPGSAYVAFFDPAGGPADRDMSARGGIALRTGPRIGVAGTLEFSGSEAARLLAEICEALVQLRERRAEIVRELGPLIGPAAVRDVETAVDTALEARFVLWGSRLSIDAWFPEGTALRSLSGSLLVALPAALAAF